jgi:hypothetical protein
MYELLFPQQSFMSKQALKNPSDMIKLNENSTMGLPMDDSITDVTGHGLSLEVSANQLLPGYSPQNTSRNEAYDALNTSGLLHELDSQLNNTNSITL